MKYREMRNFKRANWVLAIGVAGCLFLGGCKKQTETNTAPAGPSSTSSTAAPAESGANTPAPGTAMQSQAAPPPMTAMQAQSPSAAPPPPPPQPTVYTVTRGTRLIVRISQTLSTKQNNVGDNFRGALVQSVRVGGVPVLKAGTPVLGTVVGAKGQGRFKGAGALAIALSSVGSQPVTTTAYEKAVSGKGKRSTAFIGGGGGGGALIGALAGGGKGALIGGLVGAGAGTAGAAFTGNTNISIPAESVVSFTLTSPITVTVKP